MTGQSSRSTTLGSPDRMGGRSLTALPLRCEQRPGECNDANQHDDAAQGQPILLDAPLVAPVSQTGKSWAKKSAQIPMTSVHQRPDAQHDQHHTAPALDPRGLGPQLGDKPLLGQADGKGKTEHQQDDHQAGNAERGQRRHEAANRERAPDQTGQDRSRLAKACEDVSESEEAKAQLRALPPQPRLPPHEGVGDGVGRARGP